MNQLLKFEFAPKSHFSFEPDSPFSNITPYYKGSRNIFEPNIILNFAIEIFEIKIDLTWLDLRIDLAHDLNSLELLVYLI